MALGISKTCPICKKPATEKYRPFCSSRCADIDLGGWLSEKYTIAGAPVTEDLRDGEEEESG